MFKICAKSIRISVLAVLGVLFSMQVIAQHEADQHATEGHSGDTHQEEKEAMNPGYILMKKVLDKHEFQFAEYNGHSIGIPLPIIVYTKERGISTFMSSRFDHGHKDYNGFRLLTDHETAAQKIVAVGPDGNIDDTVKVYNFSITRNVAQMWFSLILLAWIMISVANRYKKEGSNKAPTGMQNAIEPVITFIRDDVAKPNLGFRYERFMPLLLTLFFFILINNLTGLIPGAANVTGNISVTIVLGMVSLVVILLNTNKHFWGHIFNPPVPGFVKPVLTIVEFLSVFIKPVALTIRLFANMLGGGLIIGCLILMIFIFADLTAVAGLAFSPVSILFTIFMYAIKLLVSFIQAYIFTNLTGVFIGLSMEGEQFREEGAPSHH